MLQTLYVIYIMCADGDKILHKKRENFNYLQLYIDSISISNIGDPILQLIVGSFNTIYIYLDL